MKSISVCIARILLGAAFLFFGLNGFLHFFTPPAPTGVALTVFSGLTAAGYLFPMMSGFMTLCGVLLLIGRFVPLALTLMAPILINIIGYHLVIDPGGIGIGAFLTVLEVFLAWSYRAAFMSLLAMKPTLPVDNSTTCCG